MIATVNATHYLRRKVIFGSAGKKGRTFMCVSRQIAMDLSFLRQP